MSTSPLVVRIPLVRAWNGTVYIHADGSIEPQAAPVQQNGDLYTLTDDIVSDVDGIVIEKNSVTFDGNAHTVQGNYGGIGLTLTSVGDVTFRNTNIQGFYYGAFLNSALQNTISGINVTTNDIGIVLISSSNYNNIAGNNVEENTVGILLDSSSNNNIYHDNFVNNTQQVNTHDSTNIWDQGYPAGGNYWSDYTEADLNRGPYQNETGVDGIGDTPYIIDQSNVDHYPLTAPLIHDVGITGVSKSKTVVGQGFTLSLSVNVTNYGGQPETLSLFTYANSTLIKIQTTALAARASGTLNFPWDTSGFAKGNYTVNTYTPAIPGETKIADNNCTGGIVVVTIPGDIDGDGYVFLGDLGLMGAAWSSTPTSPSWNPNADIVGEGQVFLGSLGVMAQHWTEK
jgi:parallel beta-helix repeat protein